MDITQDQARKWTKQVIGAIAGVSAASVSSAVIKSNVTPSGPGKILVPIGVTFLNIIITEAVSQNTHEVIDGWFDVAELVQEELKDTEE